MKSLKSIICITIRGYARRSPATMKLSKAKHKVPTDAELYPDINEYNYNSNEDYDDLSDEESDFSNIGRLYPQHLREVKHAKNLLKKRIIARKYFKSTDPDFITWCEKDQIKILHERNNVEWTPEKLSESFPALPETIRRILKAKWLPKSVQTVVKHDQHVIDNWKAFKTGSLALDPRLEDHLKKFEDRKLEIASLATIAEKFVQKSPVFSTPKSKMFSSIVENRIELPRKEIEKNKVQITDGIKKTIPLVTKVSKSVNSHAHVTFDAFLNNKIDKLVNTTNLSLENRLLIDEYKKQKNIETLTNNDSTLPECNTNKASAVVTNEPSIVLETIPKIDIKKSSIETGVLQWKKKEIINDGNFPNFIKIPRTKVNTQVTFKVQDRYYDSDGEFLYRVPGLKTGT